MPCRTCFRASSSPACRAGCRRQQVDLGLDLQGGSHLLLEVDVEAVVRERLPTRSTAIRSDAAQQAHHHLEPGGRRRWRRASSFRVRDAAQVEQARQILAKLDRTGQINVSPRTTTISLRLNQQDLIEQRRQAVEQSIEIVRRRIDETGTKEPTIQRQGQDRILVQLPGVRQSASSQGAARRTAKMTFQLVDTTTSVEEARRGHVPPGSELLPATRKRDAGGKPRMYLVQRRVMVGGDMLSRCAAQPTSRPASRSSTSSSMRSARKRFGDATRENVGKPLAIVLDNKVISAPVIREPILGGSGISPAASRCSRRSDLALLLRAGALPAPITILEERTVGPDLGADSIEAGDHRQHRRGDPGRHLHGRCSTGCSACSPTSRCSSTCA